MVGPGKGGLALGDADTLGGESVPLSLRSAADLFFFFSFAADLLCDEQQQALSLRLSILAHFAHCSNQPNPSALASSFFLSSQGPAS